MSYILPDVNDFIFRRDEDGGRRVQLRGDWTFGNIAALKAEVNAFIAIDSATEVLDCKQISTLDSVGAAELLNLQVKCSAGLKSLPPLQNLASKYQALVDLVSERHTRAPLPRAQGLSLLQTLGRSSIEISLLVSSLLQFILASLSSLGQLCIRPSAFRAREFFMQLKVACVDAIPIVALVTFLIGVVVAYLSAIQIEKFGANIFLVDGVSLALCRELSPIIVAVVVAGRSGSAFTAQIGTMKLNEEIDAIHVMGLSPMQVLVIPRALALMLAMPLLVMVGDVSGLLGSMLIAKTSLGLTATTFIDRLQIVLTIKSFTVGLMKAPVFALFIALIGCKMGLTVENNARSIGLNTTSTVVQSIVAVILLNAGFAVLFQKLGI